MPLGYQIASVEKAPFPPPVPLPGTLCGAQAGLIPSTEGPWQHVP